MLGFLAYVAAAVIGTGTGLVYVNADTIAKRTVKVVSDKVASSVDQVFNNMDNAMKQEEPVFTQEKVKNVVNDNIVKPEDSKVDKQEEIKTVFEENAEPEPRAGVKEEPVKEEPKVEVKVEVKEEPVKEPVKEEVIETTFIRK